MGSDKEKSQSTATKLRCHAEDRLREKIAEPYSPMTQGELQRSVHELEVHQIELEMQNSELRRAQEELEISRNKYSELYEFAPVGYFSFDASGLIQEVNFAGAQLLGMEKELLIHRPLISFIADSDEKNIFSSHLELVLKRRGMLKCALRLTQKDGTVIHCHLQSVAITNDHTSEYILTSVIDVTVRKQFEEMLKKAHDNLETSVKERTKELNHAIEQLTQEVIERRNAEELLKEAFEKIKELKDSIQAENIYLQQEIAREYNFGEIVGQSSAISYVFFRVDQVAPMNASVLLLGETGTGKGMIARAIHSRSTRKDRPMITVNCTALPANLIESELFGREKGAFTGASARQIGRFELADGGTIFLDEIGEMPMELQCKLLRVIQDGEFERLGSPHTIKTDVRIIAASNRNLEEEIRNGNFREDLFYRLNVFPITIPPLRQRKEDIPLLVNYFVTKFNKKIGKNISSVSKETLNALEEYHWPGNVRELESVIERAVIVSQGTSLQVLDRFDSFSNPEETAGQEIKVMAELEHDHILQVLQKTGWRIEGKNGAAILLGLNASTLRARMRKLGITRN